MNRRDVMKIAGTALAGVAGNSFQAAASGSSRGSKKSVIVIGAGISGLCCAYELTRRGHDVTVFEASGRPGGHVRTWHDPFADGLYDMRISALNTFTTPVTHNTGGIFMSSG